ncbi:E3 SUMO-protein ligase NSE2 isoform X2 [Pteronotus mesoamericanus]|uniref:E3 SUMO-protein ligase NSE2 isoform X2 n=1 Tax=Pteronotus mesoamericanus TaxID=1884717 RepID=UPI0023ED48C7|nr:E3 SUMO-protein ligase NSE2 isoform X2 [Pteronotus parnellii mesoamericanus]
MPGRSSSNSGSTGFISFSGIESALSSLKNFQDCINTGMDTASSVALDLVETQTEVSSEYSMDKAMVEFVMMDRELNHYVKAVQSTINHVKEERPENIPDLKLLVEKKFLALQHKNSDADFQNNEKFVQFKQQLKELKKQSGKPTEDGGHSEFDKIKDKEASRAGNERGYRIFSSILISLSFLKTVPDAFERVSSPTRCHGKNKAQVLNDTFGLSMDITVLTLDFKKSLTTISC